MYAPLVSRNQLQASIKLAEPKPSKGNTTQAQAWLFTLKYYFIVVGVTYMAIKAADTETVCQYGVALMAGNTAR